MEYSSQQITEEFKQRFGALPQIYQAPGRVNLIGEHTDYNDGFVMPAAIGFYARAAIARRNDHKLVVYSANYAEQVEFHLESLPAHKTDHWSDYVVGVARTMRQAGIHLPGANILLQGDVPQGAGLSSSAAVEVVIGYALLALAGQAIDKTNLARWCQQAENEFVGARCGIMDQFIACHGQQNHALLLDCRSLEYRLLSLPDDVRWVVCNTMVKHSIADGKYNERRGECETGVKILSQYLPQLKSLRNVTAAEWASHSHALPETIFRRCHHVITENARVLQAAVALEHHDLATFGKLMYQSHESLRDDYEVSCAELDLLVEQARAAEGVYGARMTGGGFGGCTINLVKADCIAAFKEKITGAYERETNRQPEIYVCAVADGARRIA